MPLRYELPVDALIQRFKYAGDRGAGKLCGTLLAAALPTGVSGVLIPVPMHKKRYLQRGFNHSQVLARDLARAVDVPMKELAVRLRNTESQVGLTAAQRRGNVRDAFAVREAQQRGTPAVLVDDILTTGETLRALTRACKRSGYGHITIMCLARADRGSPAA